MPNTFYAIPKSLLWLICVEFVILGRLLALADLARMKYYAVAKGRVKGIFTSWDECKSHVDRYPGAVYKSFTDRQEAQRFLGPGASKASRVSKSTAKSHVPKIAAVDADLFHPVVRVNQNMVVYTDGACKGNGGRYAKAGVGVWFGHGDARNVSEPLSAVAGYEPTNNRAEMTAIIRALRLIPENSNAVIYTDSQYSMKGLQSWMPAWKRKKWTKADGKPVANQDLWMSLDSLYTHRSAKVDIKYCKAHCGIEGNEAADALATRGAGMSLKLA